MIWTPNNVDRLIELSNTKLSATKIANELGTTKNAVISSASVYDIHTIMCAIAMLAKKDSSIEIDKSKTFKPNSKAAKVFFILSKGDTPILDIELRYKGSFTAMPQFFATMTKDFQALMKEGGCSEIFK